MKAAVPSEKQEWFGAIQGNILAAEEKERERARERERAAAAAALAEGKHKVVYCLSIFSV